MVMAFSPGDEEVTILHMLPADDWFVLYDWGDEEYCEQPIIGFAAYKAEFDEEGERQSYSGIGPIVADWSNGDDGVQCVVVTTNNGDFYDVLEIYKGKHNRRRWKKQESSAADD